MPTRTLTILLADLVGSTQQVAQVNAIRAAEFLEDATHPIRIAVEEHTGRLVKFTGDGFWAVFESAREALLCADTIRDHYIRQRYTPSGFAIDGVRVVVNTADVMLEDDDILGDGVVVCARLEKSVPTNQVWLTAATREVVGASDFVFHPVGDIQLRGRPQPIKVFALENTEQSFIEYGTVLLVTDLHQYIQAGETMPPLELNDWLLTWANLHREAIRGLRGQVRQFVADMALITFSDADDAIQALLNLHSLITIHNRQHPQLPDYHFKAAVASGDIILSPTGVVGRLVNQTFDLLNQTPRQTILIDAAVQNRLQAYSERVTATQLSAPDGRQMNCYRLNLPEQVEAKE